MAIHNAGPTMSIGVDDPFLLTEDTATSSLHVNPPSVSNYVGWIKTATDKKIRDYKFSMLIVGFEWPFGFS